jgi:hypothetical protein
MNIAFDNPSFAAQKGFGIAVIIAHDHAQDRRQTQSADLDRFGRALYVGLRKNQNMKYEQYDGPIPLRLFRQLAETFLLLCFLLFSCEVRSDTLFAYKIDAPNGQYLFLRQHDDRLQEKVPSTNVLSEVYIAQSFDVHNDGAKPILILSNVYCSFLETELRGGARNKTIQKEFRLEGVRMGVAPWWRIVFDDSIKELSSLKVFVGTGKRSPSLTPSAKKEDASTNHLTSPNKVKGASPE